MSGPVYDSIGVGYRRRREPDPRIGAFLQGALGSARSILNVGAGAGAYEPTDRLVVALEPSRVMIEQRPPGSAPVVQAAAEAIPFADQSFDVGLAILTMHHWSDPETGLRELQRIARDRIVVLTWDPDAADFWIARYFPELVRIDREVFPPLDAFVDLGAQVDPVPIPADCTDGFFGSYWARPRSYLDPEVRASISTFSRVEVSDGLQALADDLESGRWEREFGAIREQPSLDVGYRRITIELKP